MDHVLNALDEHIAHQNWLLKCERNAREALEKEMDDIKAENNRLTRIVQGFQSGEKSLESAQATGAGNCPKAEHHES